MSVVVSIFKKKQDEYSRQHRNTVTSLVNSLNASLSSQPENRSFHSHVLLTMLVHITKLICNLKYYDRPEDVIRGVINKALDEKGRPKL
jgi:hypothetical protein